MSADPKTIIWLLVQSIGDDGALARALLPGEESQLDPAYNWSAPVTTPIANVVAGHERASGASCEIIDWTFDKDPEDQLRKMRKDVYDTFVGVVDCDTGEINWSEGSADMRVGRWDGDECEEREVYWNILWVEIPAAQGVPSGV